MNATTESRFAPLPPSLASEPDGPELEILERWRREQTFAAVQGARAAGEPFVFWEGPPTANGRPGIHHVIARTIKDTVCRFQTMLGKKVLRKAGWDTQGLPVELEVEKSLGISGKPEIEAFGVAEFNAQCRESVWTYRREWEEISERMGYWLDYQDPYITYDDSYVESVWYILSLFHREGLVYRGQRVLPFCGRCGTGLSAHELGQPGVYQDLMDPSVTVRMVALDPTRLAGERGAEGEQESFLVWTTTPWTLPSNVALAVHPRLEYILARVPLPMAKGDEAGAGGYERVWVAAERAAAVLPEGAQELRRVRGTELAGRRYRALFDDDCPSVDPGGWEVDQDALRRVVLANYVSADDGTGLVHQAPAYGEEDWATARENRLPVLQAVGVEGRFVCSAGPVEAGTFFKEADAALMDDLKGRGLMFKKARESHSYPHCWRCDTPLFYFGVPAWYIRTTAYQEQMVAFNRQINWVPSEIGEKRFGHWLENNIDWNISRDRYWGTPLPFWICDGCDREEAIGSQGELAEKVGGLPAGFDNHKPLIDGLTYACGVCEGTMRRTSAVVDCWFDSGSMPFAQYHWPHAPGSRERLAEQYPAHFIAEGLDQTRGWFYTLHAIGAFLGSLEDTGLPAGPAYRACMVNGLVLDKDGVKMSKRLGNVVSPAEAISTHGIDAVRWYMLSSGAPWLNKRYDDAGVHEVRRKFFGTLLNSYRFFAEYARIDGFDPADPDIPPVAQRGEIDRWLMSRVQSVASDVRSRFEAFDLSGACRALESFVSDELSNWYIRRNRRRFWKGEAGADKLAAHASLHTALSTSALLVAPVAPFMAELLWERLAPGESSVHGQLFPEAQPEWAAGELEQAVSLVEQVVAMGRALREHAGLRVRQPLRAIHVRGSDLAALELLRGDFATEQVLDELNIKGWGSIEADDGKLCQLRAKAAFRVLGKKLGARMKAAAGLIAELPPEAVERLRAGQTVELELDGEGVELGAEDVEISVEVMADFPVETDGRLVVYLDTELDDGLRAEGLAREVVNRVNGLRKDLGLAVEQRIQLHLRARGSLLERALAEHGDLIAAETLATSLATGSQAGEGLPEEAEWDLFELGETAGVQSLEASLRAV
ncbi:MAG TPA: isoleucine--tRNA ligase [Planctomycetota bacterium]|nr:isoleucine--tRNA ligase [Planctomycetota bacterium]